MFTLLLSALLAVGPPTQAGGGPAVAAGVSQRVVLTSRQPEAQAARLHRAGFDVLETRAGILELIVSPLELQALRDLGLEPEIVDAGQPFRSLQAGYPDLAQIEAQLAATADAHPDLCQLVDLTAHYAVAPTVEGRHLLALKISDAPDLDQDEPAVLIVSAHHARELVTPVLALDAIDTLLAGYGTDPFLTALVDDFELWIAPVWNPDGYAHVFDVDNLWRKNRRVFSGGVGVDLNRNYPVGWDDGCGSNSQVSTNTYRGPSPASEAETQTMLALAADRHFARVLDFHSYGSEVRFGYGCWDHPQEAWLQELATDVSLGMGYGGDIGGSCCLGGDIHMHTAMYGSVALLPETHTSFQPDYASALAEAQQVVPGALAFLGAPLPVVGHVTDACTGEPLVAEVDVLQLSSPHGETNASFGPFGRFHAQLAPGTWTLRFTAFGYGERFVPVTVVEGQSTALDVELLPVTGCWTELDGGTSGVHGTPHLMGGGALIAGWPVQLLMTDAAPGALALLLISVESTPTPFLGGQLHAFPFIEQLVVATSSTGGWSGGTLWPPGLPPGQTAYYQFAIADPSVALFGASLSNGLRSLSP